jgi:hypothetical protein
VLRSFFGGFNWYRGGLVVGPRVWHDFTTAVTRRGRGRRLRFLYCSAGELLATAACTHWHVGPRNKSQRAPVTELTTSITYLPGGYMEPQCMP